MSPATFPATYVSSFGKGASLTIRLPFVSDEEIPVKVAACNRDLQWADGRNFPRENMSKELSSLRMEDVQIQLVKHTGLRVPKEAIVTNEAFETGVYIRVGNTVVFRKIDRNTTPTPPTRCAGRWIRKAI